ncbi:hypothetical protein E8E11_011930 [Didymella keratinophila]|nr:hypothetical protein E8E11_011930 [Didymella keratinophila]
MRKMGNLEVKAIRCRNELQRIIGDINTVHSDIPEIVRVGRLKWLIDCLVTLGEEKQAVTAVLEKTTKWLESKKRRQEKQRQQAVKMERGRKSLHADTTKTPGIKAEPS